MSICCLQQKKGMLADFEIKFSVKDVTALTLSIASDDSLVHLTLLQAQMSKLMCACLRSYKANPMAQSVKQAHNVIAACLPVVQCT